MLGAREHVPSAAVLTDAVRAQVENDQELYMVYRKEGAPASHTSTRPPRPTTAQHRLTSSPRIVGSDEWEPIALAEAGGDGAAS